MIDRVLVGVRLFIFIVVFEAVVSQAQRANSDDLYILLDEISVFSCRGGKRKGLAKKYKKSTDLDFNFLKNWI